MPIWCLQLISNRVPKFGTLAKAAQPDVITIVYVSANVSLYMYIRTCVYESCVPHGWMGVSVYVYYMGGWVCLYVCTTWVGGCVCMCVLHGWRLISIGSLFRNALPFIILGF